MLPARMRGMDRNRVSEKSRPSPAAFLTVTWVIWNVLKLMRKRGSSIRARAPGL